VQYLDEFSVFQNQEWADRMLLSRRIDRAIARFHRRTIARMIQLSHYSLMGLPWFLNEIVLYFDDFSVFRSQGRPDRLKALVAAGLLQQERFNYLI